MQVRWTKREDREFAQLQTIDDAGGVLIPLAEGRIHEDVTTDDITTALMDAVDGDEAVPDIDALLMVGDFAPNVLQLTGYSLIVSSEDTWGEDGYRNGALYVEARIDPEQLHSIELEDGSTTPIEQPVDCRWIRCHIPASSDITIPGCPPEFELHNPSCDLQYGHGCREVYLPQAMAEEFTNACQRYHSDEFRFGELSQIFAVLFQ